MPDSLVWYLVAVLATVAFSFFMAGRQTTTLARMEIQAAVNVAKQEVGWEYQRLRLQSMRMDWVRLPVEARKEYERRWGNPTWSKESSQPDPVTDVPRVRGPIK